MIVRGQSVDLIQLFANVKKKGGYKKVTENGLWDFVASECGFDSSDGLAVKLVYAENLEKILKSLKRISEERNVKSAGKIQEHSLMDLSSNPEPFLSNVSEINNKKDSTYVKMDWNKCDSDAVFVGKLPKMVEYYDPVKSNEDILNCPTICVPNFVKEDFLASVEFKSVKNESVHVIDKRSDSIVVKEDVCCLKRKRESTIGVLDWINKVARDPCDPEIGLIPESSEWKDYSSSDITWKQILLIHEAMLLKRNGYSNDQHITMQKRQRMHPTMYDEPEKFRHSPRILSAKDSLKKSRSQTVSKSSSSGKRNEYDGIPNYLSNKRNRIRVNIGKEHQADVQEWTAKKEKKMKSQYEFDSKWLGTPMWPPTSTKQHNKNLIEREPLGKGRSDSCGCRFPGSIECVRFHVSEKCKRLKLELGIAFYLWKFNRMGEETSVTWTKEEENKFNDTWKSNPVLSLGGFLDQSLKKALPNKSRASLVNYYFNVFILRRRGQQNRTNPNNITSDDEEDEDEDTESEHVKPITLDSTKKTGLKKSR